MLYILKEMESRKLGCLIGALAGDAAGATLEFYHGDITEDVVRNAMKMPGGGALGVGPGQVTDDGELMLSLAGAIQDGFDVDKIARAYNAWYKSAPFDCGITCRRAFVCENAQDMKENAAIYSKQSEANGALMRCMPIPVFNCGKTVDMLMDYAKADAALSHPSQACQDVNVLYSIAIAYLLLYPGDYIGAIEKVERYSKYTCRKVKWWLKESDSDLEQLNCEQNIGHVRWGFTMAMHFLRKNTSYEDAIFQTLMKGGDTDTNACIVGGMMGALHGVAEIPDYMKEPVLKFDAAKQGGHVRPDAYKASNILKYFESGKICADN